MDLDKIRRNERTQAVLGLLFGIAFGFLLQKGAVTRYDVIMGQLLLTDFTVVKVMATAVLTAMIGLYLLRSRGLAERHIRAPSIGSNVIGGLIFGAGFGLLGYCPGTVAGAVGQGSLDALFGGVPGLLIGAGVFAVAYPALSRRILSRGGVKPQTLPEFLHVREETAIVLAAIAIVVALSGLELLGF
jgi:hypothetical protein